MNIIKPLRTIQVLLVEDSAAVALQIQNFLGETSELRFDLEHVTNLSTGINRAIKGGIDVILLDLGLPDSDGLSTFEKMHEKVPDVPMVVFTGVSDEELALEALRQGAQDYLVKGQVDGRLLQRAIRYAMGRKKAEEKLRISEEKHRTLLEAMPDIVYKIDPEGYFTYVNSAVERLGYDAEKLIGKHFAVIVHPEDIERVSRSSVLPSYIGVVTGYDSAPKLLDERRSGDRLTQDLILKLIPDKWNAKDDSGCLIGSLTSYGEVTAAGAYLTNEETNKKQFTGTVGIIKDITERRRIEEEKTALEAQLQQSQKMEAIGRLAGGVAHDMNNVLGAIQGSASVLEVETDSADPKKEDIDNILLACRKGRDLTRNLLGFARKGKYVKQSISLNKVAEEARELLTRTITKKIAVEMQMDNDLEYIEGDRSQIHHALMNICINSADSIEGSGKITIVTENVTLEELECKVLGGLKPGKYTELRVIDTGTGMSRETLRKAFEPFFTTKPKGEGTGLGLSMVYGVVKNHGGAVTIDSEMGRGTTVTFILPVFEHAQQEQAENLSKMPSSKPARGGVLLVDDELIIRTSARRLLEKLGYTVFLAENGQIALEVYKKRRDLISLVLLDMIMPVMDGPETFQELLQINPEVKVVLLSGYSKDEKVEPLLDNGATGFIQKPFDLRILSNMLKKAF
ncbi:MAG: response regulator [Proteobacteria bacterium]|nr:response regulator [Pseudomonadota bacterium]